MIYRADNWIYRDSIAAYWRMTRREGVGARKENWRERRRTSRAGRQDGGQRAVETGMSSPPVPPDEAGVERTAQRQ
ncbi:TPA: hypothetical protein ACXE8O_005442, partial [Klebsiella variicola]